MKTFIFTSANVVAGTNNSRYRYSTIGGGIAINKNEKIAVASVLIPYSWYNINKSLYDNADFSYSFDGTTYNVTVPDGFYTISALNDYLQYHCLNTSLLYLVNGTGNYVYYLEFIENTSQYKIQLNCYPVPAVLPAGWTNPNAITLNGFCPQLTILSNGLRTLIGFTAASYPSAANVATNQSFLSTTTPNMSPVNAILLHCSLANNEVSVSSNCIFVFGINASFGSNIMPPVAEFSFIDIKSTNTNNFDIWFTDQNLNAIQINDPNIVVQLMIL